MMVNLISVLEGIRIRFAEPQSMNFEETWVFEEGGTVTYSVFIEYKLIGAFLEENRIKVVVNIKRFDCSEDVFDIAIEAFEKNVKAEIVKRIPETLGCIDILSVRIEDLKKISEYAYAD